MIYKPKYFKIEELVDPATFEKFGDKAFAFFRPQILIALDYIREKAGPLIVNNWQTGGPLRWRGLRTADYTESKTMPHRLGAAIDCHSSKLTAEDLRGLVISESVKHASSTIHPIHGVRRMERGVNWLHIDCIEGDHDGILLFDP